MNVNENDDQDKKPKLNKTLMNYYLIMLITIFTLNWLIIPMMSQNSVTPTTYSQFMDNLEKGQVQAVQLDTNSILYTAVDENNNVRTYKTGIMNDPNLVDRLNEKDVTYGAVIQEKPNIFLSFIMSYGVPILIFVLLQRSMSKRMAGMSGGLFSPTGEKVKKYEPDKDKKTFTDVAGQEEAEESLKEIVDYLQNSEKYTELGAKCPKGAILVGPPGTGKTLLAKAVAGEAEVPFYSISGSEFVEMFVGRGAAKVRELFDEAKKNAPCIVFIDEIDTIGKKRDSSGMGGNDEREQTLNQLLTEMDGFGGNSGIVVLAATNRPEILDGALLRPGRFDRQVRVELPDLEGRMQILKVHAEDYKMAEDIDFHLIARSTAGASGAQLANILNEAALRAVRLNHSEVTQGDIEESIETVIAGAQKKNDILSPEEKKIVAYHEIGHALVAALQSHSAPVQKITIVPRTSGTLGYTMQVEEADKNLVSKDDLLTQLATLAGGRAAEEVVFGIVTTGASNDIERATSIARSMVGTYGMSDNFGMVKLQDSGSRYMGGGGEPQCSEATAKLMDEEVISMVRESQEKARTLIRDNMPAMNELTDYLLEKETITGEEFMTILEKHI